MISDFLGAGRRSSIVRRKAMPSFEAIDCASAIMTIVRAPALSGKRQMPTIVAWLSALIGLNETLPQAFSQSSARISVITRDLKPARVKRSDNLFDALCFDAIELADREAIPLHKSARYRERPLVAAG